jgi:hypothetical protein
MTLICAWCKRVMRAGDPELPISHGMCPACRKKFEQETA